MRQSPKVLAIMQPGDERERLCHTADGEAWDVEFCKSVAEALCLLHSGCTFAAILLDKDLIDGQWEKSVRNLAGADGTSRIILASESTPDGLWERVVEQGGHDLLSKPLRVEQVRRAVLHALWYAATLNRANR